MKKKLLPRLAKKAKLLRKMIIEIVTHAGSGHMGGSLSAVEIITALYFHQLRIKPKDSKWEDRDRFVLSKGHAAPILYAALAERGFFNKKLLKTLRKNKSLLQGHTDMHKTPGVDMSNGSLGQGLSVGLGMALGAKMQNKKFRVYVLLGDGELNEGEVWEAAMAIPNFGITNLTAIVDCNGLQHDGKNEKIMSLSPLADKWEAFGWKVIKIDGHDLLSILKAFELVDREKEKPMIILASTIKGKGVSMLEGKDISHNHVLNIEECKKVLAEL